MATKVNFPIPQEKISECFAWRDWFQKLANAVFGNMATQDAGNVNITGGNITGVSIPISSVSGAGSMATQDANNVNITGGTLTGVTVPLADITGAGTMAAQNSASVSITGGSVTATIGMSNATSTSATAGTSGVLPAQVAGYTTVNIGGTNYKIPYYNT